MNYSTSASIVIDAARAEVWDWLTKPELVKRYFFDTDLDTTWEPGSLIRFTGAWEGKTYEDKGTVLSYDEGTGLSYSYWSPMSGTPDEPDSYQVLSYDLEGPDGEVKVTISQSNAPSQESADHSGENWMKVLASLKDLLERDR